MKGKNKLILILFAVMALVATSVGFALKSTVEAIRYANAEAIPGFTAKLDGDVIFSAERVYFAVDGDKDAGNDYLVRQNQVTYKGYDFNPIVTNNGVEYFGDYSLTNGNGYDYSHKKVVNNGDFVMANDKATYSDDSNSVSIKEGIMITLGGYYFAHDNIVGTNSQVWGDTNNDEQNDALIPATDEVGAQISYVSAVQATLNGEPITLPNSRDYNNASHEDFTWFIIPSEATEGHYKISFLYSMKGFAQPLPYEFEFYLLLQSSYDKQVEVNGNSYPTSPQMSNYSAGNRREGYSFYSGTTLNYPTLTFDYSRYDLSYTYTSGDRTTDVDFEYDESTKLLNLSHKLYETVEQEPPYIIDEDITNTIVTLMFVEQGKYDFHFDYIYNVGEKITIPQEQVPFENIKLNIHGYQLKYSKAGFTSADMTHLDIYKNGTMFILLNGFTNADNKELGDDLGVSYTLIDDASQKTGVVKSGETAGQTGNDIVDVALIKNLKYQRTDRGLWLTLKDEYVLSESFYYYNPTGAITEEYINNPDDLSTSQGCDGYENRTAFTKVTTFTAPGYYLVQVKYDYTPDTADGIMTQYFAFQITATTPMLELYKTDLEVLAGNANVENFYAHEYTNKNVYATWAETEIFESKVFGKLYYVEDKYAEESTLKAVADGEFNSSVTALEYKKNDIIKDSGAYLLVLEVEKSATRTYTYFTIDKDPISGLKVYEVVTRSVDNRAVYSIKQDKDLNYIDHTGESVIDSLFTMDWNDKKSGAEITATYKFTPFVKSNQVEQNNPITIKAGTDEYVYMINQYTIGSRSANISIQKPTNLNVSLDINNVLTDQGIYEFNLVDQAGNELNYIVIVDRTESVIKATYGDSKNNYVSGQLVADYVELEWGTHKAISLGGVPKEINGEDNIIYKLLNNQSVDNYYIDGKNNLSSLYKMFINASKKDLFIVQNMYVDIKLEPFDINSDHYYRLTHQGNQQIQYPNGATSVGWDEDVKNLFENVTNYGIKIKVDGEKTRIYNFEINGSNQVNSTSSTKFTVRITPDEALGQVFSTSQVGGSFDNEVVNIAGKSPKYFGNTGLGKDINHEDYYEAQASNDGVFVFEWARPKEGEDKFRVTQVKYNYYQLMDQDTLNSITMEYIKDANGRYVFNQSTNKYIEYDASKHAGMQRYTTNYPYYPYRYVEVSNNYILKIDDNGVESVSAYTTADRINKDDKGNTIENRQVYRSDAINLAYESYYNSKGELVTQQVTQTGLYIITRTMVMIGDEGQESEPMEFSYAFFVDRNMIVGYSINDINTKIVGQFIHVAMPNSDAENGVKYDNFNKQGLSTETGVYFVNNEERTVNYKVYLETNKLPTKIQVPSGKYVSGNTDTRTIDLTSHLNLKLKLSVYFKDTYKILPGNYNGTFNPLMSGRTGNKDGYIDLSFSNIDDEGMIAVFKNARIQANDNYLSLPGEYVFVIEDDVWSSLNEDGSPKVNQFIFGIKLTNNSPVTDVYSYAEMNGNKSSDVYADGKELYTNQEFVDFVIPVEDKDAYEAQLDIASIEVWRSDIAGTPWLRLKPISGGNGFDADASGFIKDISRIEMVKDKDGNLTSYIIHLDTGLVVENDKIVDYKEFTYTITIQYVLANSSYIYYEYLKNDDKISFYRTTYTVTIDRTPNEANLDALMQQQGKYFEGYHAWLAEQNNVQVSEDINKTTAYRNTATISDYYGLTNELYYQFASQPGQLSNQAMYALTVDENTAFNPNGLHSIYYREIKVASVGVSEADKRMGLLPITDIYGAGYYHSFNENMTAYKKLSKDLTINGQQYLYRDVFDGSDYSVSWGKFYEIVEKDMAGNLTQYVIYFASPESNTVKMPVQGNVITSNVGDNDTSKKEETVNMTFVDYANENQQTFIGITDVKNIEGLVGPGQSGDESALLYPYYGNINIYNASRDKIKTIYTNSISKHKYDVAGNVVSDISFEQEIYNVIRQEGNYIIEYVDVFGNKDYIIINNYTSGEHELNIATLQVQEDYATGQYYITFSGLNTKLSENTYWFVNVIEITYNGKTIKYTAGPPVNGISVLEYKYKDEHGNVINELEGTVERDIIQKDRLNLLKNTQYMIKLTDVVGNYYSVPISTTKGYYAYQLNVPDNIYAYDNIYYTANEVGVSYNTEHYTWNMVVEEDGKDVHYTAAEFVENPYFKLEVEQNEGYRLIKLLPNVLTENDPANYYGSLRVFKIWLTLNDNSESDGEENGDNAQDVTKSPTYTIYIDTRATNFVIENTHKVDKIDHIKSTFKNSADEDGIYQDYNIMDLINNEYYNKLIVETVNLSWTRLTSDYFTYNYRLFEFVNKDECVDLLLGANVNEYSIAPKENTTGKYILKVTIEAKDGTWIATRVYGIYMSTTITGLYEVKDGEGNVYDYASITNLEEMHYGDENIRPFISESNKSAVALALNFVQLSGAADIDTMTKTFESFGYYTAIPMYIANTELTLHSNADNGVESWEYRVESSSCAITFYRVWRSNYQTFAVTMYVKPETNKNIINTLSFKTGEEDIESLLNIGSAKTIYNANADRYQLKFNSYNANTKSNKLEQHNRIIIDVYYNNVFAKHVKGGAEEFSIIDFKNSGSYKLVIKDTAGNVQTFINNSTYQEFFTLVLMKKNDMLYTINGEAPVQYAYYDSAVTLQINRYNEVTGKNNYDINTIGLTAYRNSSVYTGYEHPTESATYVFKDYGTYLIKMSAKLLGTDITVNSQLVFTIINPNEARESLDFTSIYGYNIISVFSITKTAEKDITEKFMDLLKDKSNVGDIDVYNKLITYDRVVEALGTSAQGKIKLRVLYEVKNDDLLPARLAEFTFTLNNEKASITSSIAAGGKTTKPVTLKFNAANIYDQIGDCNLVINGETVLRIDENSSNSITEIQVTEVGNYYIQLMGDSGSIAHSFNFTIKQPLNTVSIILIVVVIAIAIALIGTFIWLRTRMKVR